MTKDLVTELRKLHTEIVDSDGHECEMMGLVRKGFEEIERLQIREIQARAILEPLAEHDPAVREWLGQPAFTCGSHETTTNEPPIPLVMRQVINHWREFGPEHGFDELIELAAKRLGGYPLKSTALHREQVNAVALDCAQSTRRSVDAIKSTASRGMGPGMTPHADDCECFVCCCPTEGAMIRDNGDTP